jgi:UDP-glucose 4-epimerase
MHVIPAIMAQLAAGGRQLKLGNLNPRRDYVHVEDVAQALFILGNMTIDKPFDIFNIGSGREYSVRELIELCSEIVSEPLETVSDPGLQRKVDRPSQLADLSKIQRTSGWKPERTLKQALSEVWEEGLENRDAHKHAAV